MTKFSNNAFKTSVTKYLLDEYVLKKFTNRCSINFDKSKCRVTVTMKDMPSEEDINRILKSNLDRFNILHDSGVRVKNVTHDSFVLEA